MPPITKRKRQLREIIKKARLSRHGCSVSHKTPAIVTCEAADSTSSDVADETPAPILSTLQKRMQLIEEKSQLFPNPKFSDSDVHENVLITKKVLRALGSYAMKVEDCDILVKEEPLIDDEDVVNGVQCDPIHISNQMPNKSEAADDEECHRKGAMYLSESEVLNHSAPDSAKHLATNSEETPLKKMSTLMRMLKNESSSCEEGELDVFARSIASQMSQLPIHLVIELQAELQILIAQKRLLFLQNEQRTLSTPLLSEGNVNSSSSTNSLLKTADDYGISSLYTKYGDNSEKAKTCGRSSNIIPISSRLTGRHFLEDSPMIGTKHQRRQCVVCAAQKKRTVIQYRCEQCEVFLCPTKCFKAYHTNADFSFKK